MIYIEVISIIIYLLCMFVLNLLSLCPLLLYGFSVKPPHIHDQSSSSIQFSLDFA